MKRSLIGNLRYSPFFALVAVIVLLTPSCAEWWQVRPYPDFVTVEVKPGDKVRLETQDGGSDKFQVSYVGYDSIEGEGRSVLLRDIAKLEKLSKVPPANPCSPQVPLGCSVPDWAQLLHESQRHFQEYFYPSCEQHDYCYRHGAATYGKSKNACDSEFLLDMQAQCNPENFIDMLALAGDRQIECSAVTIEFYMAVQKYGVNRYQSAKSTYCEYDGPP